MDADQIQAQPAHPNINISGHTVMHTYNLSGTHTLRTVCRSLFLGITQSDDKREVFRTQNTSDDVQGRYAVKSLTLLAQKTIIGHYRDLISTVKH